jgi:hypothetical protein
MGGFFFCWNMERGLDDDCVATYYVAAWQLSIHKDFRELRRFI